MKNLELVCITKDGREVWLEGTAMPRRKTSGPSRDSIITGHQMYFHPEFLFRNITLRKRQERLRSTQFEITRIIAESTSEQEALPKLVETIGINLGWEVGECLFKDHIYWSQPFPIWCAPDLGITLTEEESIKQGIIEDGFRTQEGVWTEKAHSSLNKSLPGKTSASRQPLWIEDVQTCPFFLRKTMAERMGLHTAVSIPIRTDQEVKGILQFFSRRLLNPEEEQIKILHDIGLQIGQFMARKQAEVALNEERNTLALHVEERTADLSRVNADLARANQMKDEFLSTMSHELRTPLNAILTLNESLGDGIYGEMTVSQQNILRLIAENGRHLLALINDILDLSKIEAGKMDLHLDLVSVTSLCEACMRMIRQQARKKNIQASIQIHNTSITLLADERRLKQMLVNLLSNAVKFTAEDGRIGLEVSSLENGGKVCFCVWDTGIGIPKDQLDLLFKPFTQIDPALSRQYGGGTGLGLSLVRRLAELHGGTVSVESTPGKGSRFSIILPAREPAPENNAFDFLDDLPDSSIQDLGAMGSGQLIMIAEDNQYNLMGMIDYLRARGYRVIPATNGREAIERAASFSPDLMLIDIQMPEVNGLEVIRRIRNLPELGRRPIIALTALAMSGDRERCMQAGASDYISKPVELKDLVMKIQTLLDA